MGRIACLVVGGLALFGAGCGRKPLPEPAPEPAPGGTEPTTGTTTTGTTDVGGAGPDAGVAPATGTTGSGGAPGESQTGSVVTTRPRAQPTEVPFPCNPLPTAFIFPPPAVDTPGVYTRYASYDVGPASSVAASPDGRLAALATRDGIVRLIDVAASQVVGVIAPPRASVDLVAFSPSGETLLTVARGEREATLWQVSTTSPVWTASLPGHRHDNARPGPAGFTRGGISFSPDGLSVVVSPSRGLFRLDAATGAIQASWPDVVVQDLAHDWDGRRIAVTQPSLVAHCIHSPNGGKVLLIDADTLGAATTVADYGYYPMVKGQPAFRVSPAADYLLTPGGTAQAPSLQAFHASDGAPLPPPPFTTFPLAFMPDGQRVLVAEDRELGLRQSDRELRLRRLSDGEILARTGGSASGLVAVSRDGSTVLFAGAGADLLAVWNPDGGGAARAVCTTGAGTAFSERAFGGVALSEAGDLLAVSHETEVHLLRAADGTSLRTFPGAATALLKLSPDGRYLIGPPASPWPAPPPAPLASTPAPGVFSTEDGELAGPLGVPGRFWYSTAFAPDSRAVYGSFFANGHSQLWMLDLTSGGTQAVGTMGTITMYGAVLGFSGGCLVIQDQVSGIYRSCDGHDEPPFAVHSRIARLSPGGRFVAALDPGENPDPGVTLYQMPPDLTTVRHFPRRPMTDAEDTPLAITATGTRLFLGARPSNPSCYMGPLYEVHVHDVATGRLLDTLPPGMHAADADAQTLAYTGAQVWRAR